MELLISSMYNLQKNNYHLKPKPSTIYTPPEVSEFIFNLLKDKFSNQAGQRSWILDPCCGKGSLLEPWNEAGYFTYGVDLEKNKLVNSVKDFLTMTSADFRRLSCSFEKPEEYQMQFDLILCNPPFNGYKNKLASEVWLDKIIELFGKEAPIVLFAPEGFSRRFDRLNSKRLAKLESGFYPRISSRITLPKNIFPEVEFHSEILIFNIKGLEPHYFFKPCPN